MDEQGVGVEGAGIESDEEVFPAKGSVVVDDEPEPSVEATRKTDEEPPVNESKPEDEEEFLLDLPNGQKKYKKSELLDKFTKQISHITERDAEIQRLRGEIEAAKQPPARKPDTSNQFAVDVEATKRVFIERDGLDERDADAAARSWVGQVYAQRANEARVARLEQEIQQERQERAQREELNRRLGEIQKSSPGWDPRAPEYAEDCQRIINEASGNISLEGLHRTWQLEQEIRKLREKSGQESERAAKSRMAPTKGGGGAGAKSSAPVIDANNPMFDHMSDGAKKIFQQIGKK